MCTHGIGCIHIYTHTYSYICIYTYIYLCVYVCTWEYLLACCQSLGDWVQDRSSRVSRTQSCRREPRLQALTSVQDRAGYMGIGSNYCPQNHGKVYWGHICTTKNLQLFKDNPHMEPPQGFLALPKRLQTRSIATIQKRCLQGGRI